MHFWVVSAKGWTCIICPITRIITSVLARLSFALKISKIEWEFGKVCTIHTYINAHTHKYYNISGKITSAEGLVNPSRCHSIKQGRMFYWKSQIAVAYHKLCAKVWNLSLMLLLSCGSSRNGNLLFSIFVFLWYYSSKRWLNENHRYWTCFLDWNTLGVGKLRIISFF